MALVTLPGLDGVLPLIASGKVRELYQVDDNSLLFVATDRISAYDVIMKNVSRPIYCPLKWLTHGSRVSLTKASCSRS